MTISLKLRISFIAGPKVLKLIGISGGFIGEQRILITMVEQQKVYEKRLTQCVRCGVGLY